MNIFFTSDTHFGHKNIIKYCNRPFSSVDEMNEVMIENWNKVVRKGDLVYHLGDFCMGIEDKEHYATVTTRRLNGAIHLILGNHDPKNWLYGTPPFHLVEHYREISEKGQRIVLFHYGMRTWHRAHKGVWHLFGHTHGTLAPYGKSLDIGVDCWNFTPVAFDELKAVMDKREIGSEFTPEDIADAK